MPSPTDNGKTFTHSDLIDSTIAVATLKPQRLEQGEGLGPPLSDRVVNARRLKGVAFLRIAFGGIWTTIDVRETTVRAESARRALHEGRFTVDCGLSFK